MNKINQKNWIYLQLISSDFNNTKKNKLYILIGKINYNCLCYKIFIYIKKKIFIQINL